MKLLTLGLFETVIVDRTTNKVSLINMIEEMRANIFPAAMPSYIFFCYLEKDKGEPNIQEFKLIVRLSGELIADQPFSADFQGKDRNRITLNIANLTLEKEGILEFAIEFPNESRHAYEIIISK